MENPLGKRLKKSVKISLRNAADRFTWKREEEEKKKRDN